MRPTSPLVVMASIALLLAVSVTAPAGPAAAQDPVPPPLPPERAVLVVQRQADYIGGHVQPVSRLLVIDTDGSLRRLVPGQADAASWSPDGSQVAYRTIETGALHLVDRDGDGDRLLLDRAGPALPAFSPQGTHVLAIQSLVTGGGRLVTVDVATGAVVELHTSDQLLTAPSWSPAGDRVAFGAVSTSGGQYDLWVVDADGSNLQQLTTDLRVGSTPTWAPDGGQLAVVAFPTEGDTAVASIHVVAADGSGARALPGPAPASSEAAVAWSPFSDQIAYTACQPAGCGAAPEGVAVVVAAGGAEPVMAAPAGGATGAALLAWRGPTQLLVSQSYGDTTFGVLAEVDLTGGEPRVLSEPLGTVPIAAINPGPQPPPLTATVARALWWSRMLPDDSADTVLLGRADAFADSLASGGAQGALGAPLLLTPTERMEPAVAREIERLGAERVVILGGDQAISPAVESLLGDAGLATSRLSGPTRLETAVAIAEQVFAAPRRILLTRAHGVPGDPTAAFADSLAAGAAAAGLTSPLLLTQTDVLSDPVAAYLDRTPSVVEVVVVGGSAAVGDAVVTALQDRGLVVTRVAGPERTATAAAVSQFAIEADAGDDSPAPPGGTYVVVDGTDPLAWADGFAAAQIADPTVGGGVLLVRPGEVPQPTELRLATGARDATVACASLIGVTTCRDAEGAHDTTTPEALATARLQAGEVFGDVRVQQRGTSSCAIVSIEGADLAAARIEADQVIELPAPIQPGRTIECVRWLFSPLDVDHLLQQDAVVVVTTTAGQELRAPLERADTAAG